MFLSQSQTFSDVKMVQSLIPIWEVGFTVLGIHELILVCCLHFAYSIVFFYKIESYSRKNMEEVVCIMHLEMCLLILENHVKQMS